MDKTQNFNKNKRTENIMHYKCALTIAGSDSAGGAGVQADIKTMSALGVYAASAITAVTVQNTQGVYDIQAIKPEIVAGQIRAVMDDIKPVAVKIGMVNDAATIHAIAETLGEYSGTMVVVDPVMVSTSGCRLMKDDALEIFQNELMPLASLLTPNLPEAEILAGMRIRTVDDMNMAARKICSEAHCDVLVKGGHLDGEKKTDILYSEGKRVATYENQTIDTRNTHGTGCTLSSAITAHLALGLNMTSSISHAIDYLHTALEEGKDVTIGKGFGPVNHFFAPRPLVKNAEKYNDDSIRLQFITHQNEQYGYVEGARMALEGGCRWIQLRMKGANDDEVASVAMEIGKMCREYGATFLLDDRVELAKKVMADGVHLGKNDMPVDQARQVLGPQSIIGGTANTFEDIERLARQGADYIGCGPFRYTTTKKNLSPILGLEGYRQLTDKMRKSGIQLPIVAIGGILADDIPSIMHTGVSGIAVSGAILNAANPAEEMKTFVEILNK